MKILTLIALLFVMGCGGDDRHGYGSHIVLDREHFKNYKDFQQISYRFSLNPGSGRLDSREYTMSISSFGRTLDGENRLLFDGVLTEEYCVQFTEPLNSIRVELNADGQDRVQLLGRVAMFRDIDPSDECPLVVVENLPLEN